MFTGIYIWLQFVPQPPALPSFSPPSKPQGPTIPHSVHCASLHYVLRVPNYRLGRVSRAGHELDPKETKGSTQGVTRPIQAQPGGLKLTSGHSAPESRLGPHTAASHTTSVVSLWPEGAGTHGEATVC